MCGDDIAKPERLVNHAQKSLHWQHLFTAHKSRLVSQGRSAASCTDQNVAETRNQTHVTP